MSEEVESKGAHVVALAIARVLRLQSPGMTESYSVDFARMRHADIIRQAGKVIDNIIEVERDKAARKVGELYHTQDSVDYWRLKYGGSDD